ncbi:MAG: hypothetical protein E7342_01470 [Clostridiales bacterium]|nr:hypothetical protein [Clostridiales bacterium]
MTEKLTKFKSKAIFAFLLVCLLSFTLAFTVACSNDPTKINDGKFTKTETDTQLITNGNFEFGVSSMTIADYPDTTVSNWSIAVDNGASSSKVSSGAIKATDEAFSATVNKLYEDADFRNWALKYYFDADDTTELKKDAETALGEDASSTEVNKWIKEKVVNRIMGNDADYNADGKVFYKNPGVATETAENEKHVLMLNNFLTSGNSSTYYGFGTAQKATSSKTLTLTKGSYGKVTVFVKTGYLTSKTADEFGANIRLISNVSNTTQDEYSISNINTNGEWAKYVIYVKPNNQATSNIKVVLGLGYGNGANFFDYTVEGTAYFDNVSFEELTAKEYADEVGTTFNDNFTSVDFKSTPSTDKVPAKIVNKDGANLSLFSLATEDSENVTYFNEVDLGSLTLDGDYTTSSTGVEGNKFNKDDQKSGYSIVTEDGKDAIKITTDKTSYGLVVKSDGFTIANQQFMQISFLVKANLAKFDKTGLSVYVYDTKTANVYDPSTDKYTLTVSNAKDAEWTEYSLILKNNFVDGENKNFYLALYLGPTDVANQNDPTLYPTGDVYVADIRYAVGNTTVEEDATDDVYDIYFLNNKAVDNAKSFAVALYANNNADYAESSSKDTFTFSVAPSDEGTITHSPANALGFTGVSSNHIYVNPEGTDSSVNANDNAGLINSNYFGNYSIPNLAQMVNWNGDDTIQPLMIYNKEASSYGFISTQRTIAVDSFYVITVDVRAFDGATAFVYLADATNSSDILNQKFTADNGKIYSTDMFFEVTSDMCNETESGFVTLSFYVATGATSKNLKIELWNGSRDGKTPSKGYVFFDNLVVSSSFTEGNFENAASPLYNAFADGIIDDSDLVYYTQKLTNEEIEYNKQVNDDEKFKYSSKIVLASDFDYELVDGVYVPANHKGTFLYTIFNTIDPSESVIPSIDNDEGSSCTTNYDPSTFWLSFSSVLLAAAIFVALVAVIVKTFRTKNKKNKSDAKSHYKVVSRNKITKVAKKEVSFEDFEDTTDEIVEEVTEPVEEITEEPVEEVQETEESEEYTYGEVLEDFSDDDKNN